MIHHNVCRLPFANWQVLILLPFNCLDSAMVPPASVQLTSAGELLLSNNAVSSRFSAVVLLSTTELLLLLHAVISTAPTPTNSHWYPFIHWPHYSFYSHHVIFVVPVLPASERQATRTIVFLFHWRNIGVIFLRHASQKTCILWRKSYYRHQQGKNRYHQLHNVIRSQKWKFALSLKTSWIPISNCSKMPLKAAFSKPHYLDKKSCFGSFFCTCY